MKTIIFIPTVHINTDILGQDDVENDHNEIYIGDTNRVNDPIKIDDLIMILNGLKDEGSNYVSIDFHTDHLEYELDGQIIRLATQEEINEQERKDKQFKIDFCKKQIDNASRTKANFEQELKFLSGE